MKVDFGLVGKRIMAGRGYAGLSQVELARAAHTSVKTISQLENGHLTGVRLDTMARVATALECGIDELIGLEVPESITRARPVLAVVRQRPAQTQRPGRPGR